MNLLLRNVVVPVLVFLFVAATSPVFADDGPASMDDLGIVTGRVVMDDGVTIPKGIVAFFASEGKEPQDHGTTRRRPATIAFIQDDGRFEPPMFPAGSYYLGVLMRPRWRGGPPVADETRYSAFDENGNYLVFDVKGGESRDLGTIKVRVPSKTPEIKEFFTIMGRLFDEKGQPVVGSVVSAKTDYSDLRASHISEPSTFGGNYRLLLPPGKYYLVARETVANSDRPRPDSMMGELGINEPIGIGGKPKTEPKYLLGSAGQIFRKVDISMYPVPIPEVKRDETEAMIKANKFDKKNLPEGLPFRRDKVGEGVPSEHLPEKK